MNPILSFFGGLLFAPTAMIGLWYFGVGTYAASRRARLYYLRKTAMKRAAREYAAAKEQVAAIFRTAHRQMSNASPRGRSIGTWKDML